MKKEIRKKVDGPLEIFLGRVVLQEHEGAYLYEYGRIYPIRTIGSLSREEDALTVLGGRTAAAKKSALGRQKLRPPKERRTAVLDPGLVIYSAKDDLFFKFDRIVGNQAVFKKFDYAV